MKVDHDMTLSWSVPLHLLDVTGWSAYLTECCLRSKSRRLFEMTAEGDESLRMMLHVLRVAQLVLFAIQCHVPFRNFEELRVSICMVRRLCLSVFVVSVPGCCQAL